jgi:pyruvate carboxylase
MAGAITRGSLPCFCSLQIAGGLSLKDLGMGSQEEVPPIYGYAIQCRVTSEDPEQNFQPDAVSG